MSKDKKNQYTIRAVPPELDHLLRKRAREEHLSLNRAALKVLNEALSGNDERIYHDLDFCINSWDDEPEVEQALKNQRKIDKDLWR